MTAQLIAANALKQIGIANIDQVMSDGKINLKNFIKNDVQSNAIPVHTGLAASYGTLTKESIKMIDDKLKILIAGTVRELQKIPGDQRSWDRVLSTFKQNSLMEPVAGSDISKADKLIKDYGTSAFKFDGSPDSAIVREVQTWFNNLINDSDVIKDTKIDINMMGDIVACTGATVDSFESFFGKHEYHERTVVDIGVLRFPDLDHPYVKLYRIQLKAWSDCSRVLFVQDDKNGITGEYNCERFKPRESVMSGLREETREKAIEEAEDLFA